MAWWQRQFGESTRGKIVGLLRRGRRSVDELAADLGVTDNAVRAQLSSLSRDGVVADTGPRREGVVGKPATMYAISESAETAFSAAYAPTLATLMQVLGERHTKRELDALMREVGTRLSHGVNLSGAASTEERVNAAVRFLADLGAIADVDSDGTTFTVRGHGCPLSKAVQAQPEACKTVEQILANASGGRVRERCIHNDGAPRCAFEITGRSRN